MSQIICNNITLGYDGKAVVENLSFSVEKGDYLCILGENGAGKSTLVKALLKLKKPMSGEIVMDESAERTGIGYLPQQTEIQRDFPASVYEIVLSGCVRGLGKKPFFGRQQKKLAMENMKKLGIENLAKCCYRELSGGQQQRALLARALCASKNILLLDEPAAGLDPVATNEMYSIISDLNKTQNIRFFLYRRRAFSCGVWGVGNGCCAGVYKRTGCGATGYCGAFGSFAENRSKDEDKGRCSSCNGIGGCTGYRLSAV